MSNFMDPSLRGLGHEHGSEGAGSLAIYLVAEAFDDLVGQYVFCNVNEEEYFMSSAL